jgi:acyl dehydratase
VSDPDQSWVGGDFQLGPTRDAAIALCGACRRLGRCRLGLRSETLGPDGVVTTELVCADTEEGGPGVAHGGWTAGVLDELVGHVPLLSGQLAVTGELTVRFVRPVPIGRPLLARAWRDRHEGTRWFVHAELLLVASGAELARADAVLVERDPGHFDRHRAWLAEQDGAARAVSPT